VQTSAASEQEADRLAAAVLASRLAACVQVVGPVRSHYWWQGSVESATEWLCVAKTTDDLVDQVVVAIRTAHSYDTPEIIVSDIVGGDTAYLQWVTDTVHEGRADGRVGGP